MTVMESARAGARLRTATTFASKLDSLKRNGCNLLVVGCDHEPIRTDACRRFLGCEGPEPRRRLVVAADTSVASVRDRLCASPTPQDLHTTIVDWQTPIRCATASTSAGPDSIQTIHVDGDDLSSLGIEISDALSKFATTGDPEPAEIRLCFDSLTPLVARFDEEVTFRFLHLVTSAVTRVRGMGHYHLPVGANAEMVRILEPLFDAIVELRTQSGHLEQRWHLIEPEIATEWLPV